MQIQPYSDDFYDKSGRKIKKATSEAVCNYVGETAWYHLQQALCAGSFVPCAKVLVKLTLRNNHVLLVMHHLIKYFLVLYP